MTVQEQIEMIMRKNGLRHLSAFLFDDDTIRIRTYRREQVSYYRKHAEDKREYGKNYYWKNKDRIRKYQHEYYIKRRYGISPSNGRGNRPINHEELANALAYAYSLRGTEIPMDDAMSTSLQILSFFGYENQVLGNSLDQEDLALMYQLEDLDLVKTEVEYDTVAGNKEWRINYFLLNKKKIREYASRERENETGKNEFSSIYDNLPEEAWAR